MILAVADTGSLYAAIDEGDRQHAACVAALSLPDMRLFMPALVITEVCQLVERRLGPTVEAAFVETLGDYDVRAPSPEDWVRIAELVRTYADFPLGTVDASVAVLAERLDTDVILTLDRRHFAALRPRHVPNFRLLPE